MENIEVKSDSGVLSATVFGKNSTDSILIIASATGVKQAFYQKFSEYVASNDITVITFDYHGIGGSLKKPIKKIKTNAADWGSNDLESIIKYVILNYPKSKRIVLGHSIGGQLVGLAKSAKKLDKVVLVAAQSGYWKYWKGVEKLKMWFNWYILFPILLNTFGFLNSKRISGMENLPKNVANQWRKWGMDSEYIFSDKSIIESYYDKLKMDMTAFSIDDDDFAPKEAVSWMTEKYCNANMKSIHLKPTDFQVNKIGHFGIFKNKFKNSIWIELLNEIK